MDEDFNQISDLVHQFLKEIGCIVLSPALMIEAFLVSHTEFNLPKISQPRCKFRILFASLAGAITVAGGVSHYSSFDRFMQHDLSGKEFVGRLAVSAGLGALIGGSIAVASQAYMRRRYS